jgi:hypothetical protein
MGDDSAAQMDQRVPILVLFSDERLDVSAFSVVKKSGLIRGESST